MLTNKNAKNKYMQVMTRHDIFGSVSGRVRCLALLGDGKGVWVEAAFSILKIFVFDLLF